MLKVNTTLSGTQLISIINGTNCLLFVYKVKIVEVLFNVSSGMYYPTNQTVINITNNIIVPVYTSNINIAYSSRLNYTY
jgi:hypothetical protein